MPVPAAALLDRDYLAARARLIDPTRAQDFGPGEPPRGGTVYLCAADADGMMVSLIQSNYMGFGSGVVVPGTGISLQNRGAGFSLQPGHPNEVAGGKRPFHTIIPGFLTRDGAPLRGVRRDGRPDPAAGPRADAGAPDRLRHESAGGARRAALEGQRRRCRSTSRPSASPELRAGLHRARPPAGIGARFLHGFRRGPVHRQRRTTATSRRRIRGATARPRASDARS